MPQIFRPRANALVRLFILAVAGLVVAAAVLAVALNSSPYATGEGSVPQQPVPFSHQHHVAGLGIDCGYCHTSFERSSFAGIPDTGTCMTCHSQLWTRADMLAPVRASYDNNQPLAWQRVHDLPDFVYFSHRSHVTNGIGCESCHGRVDTMPLTRQAEPLTMQWCLDCHRDPTPHLRPPGAITAMGYSPGGSDSEAALARRYDIRFDRLTECVTCHR